jgi:hypothetical protein
MTDLNKKLSRWVNLPLDNRIQARNRDKISVTLYPDGFIGFRPWKCRKEYQLPLVVAYQQAIKLDMIEAYKVKEQDARLAGRRKPRKLRLPRRGLFNL